MSTRRRAEFKLHYLNLKGRGELARLAFAYGKVPFDDIRYEREEWPQHKSKFPNGQVPVLEWRGQMLPESQAIARFLAHRVGLAGSDDWQWAQIDALCDFMGTALDGMRPVFAAGADEVKRNEAVEVFVKDFLDPMINRLEKQLIANDTGFLIGKKETLADLCLFNIHDLLGSLIGPQHMAKSVLITKHASTIGEIPAISSWIAKRPPTPY